MKTILLLAIAVMLMLPGCGKVKTVPEISDNLSDIDMMDLTGEGLTRALAKHGSKLVMIKSSGEVFRWDSENKMVDSLYNLNREITPDVFQQGDFLVARQQGADSGVHVIFDVGLMKEAAVIDDPGIRKVLGVDRDRLLFRSADNRLAALDYRSGNSPAPVAAALPKDETLFNCQWQGDQALILASHHLYRYSKSSGVFESLTLKTEAASGFLLVGDAIYYGSAQRELVKYSLRARKIRWRFKLADHLETAPVKVGPYIVVVPGDNNVYFFNKNGSIYWWQQLNSTMFMPPYAMTDNVVVFLWNQKVKLFDYKKKKVTTYPLERKPTTAPVQIGGYLYVVSTEDDDDRRDDELPALRRLSRLGNHYGLEIKTDPNYIKPMGRSVKFTLIPINMVEPRYRVKIVVASPADGDTGDGVVFEKQIGVKDKPNFVWVPPQAREYRLMIEIDAQNKKGVVVEETFNTIDVDQMLWKYYYDVQTAGDGTGGR